MMINGRSSGLRSRSRIKRVELAWFIIFISPWALGFIGLVVYPMLASAYFSFTDYSGLAEPSWIGVTNYVNLIGDPLFWHSVLVTAIFAVAFVVIQLTLGLGTALLLNLRMPGMRLLRTIYYLPSVLPIAATSMLWIFLFLPQYGMVDVVIKLVARVSGPSWLSDPQWALPALIIMSAWSFGAAMIIFLAGLQVIPKELYEAVTIDGGGMMTRLIRITIPMVTPQILLNLILGLVGAFQSFIPSYMMTNGGPDYATYLYNLSIYDNAFLSFKMGAASAQAWMLFVALLALTAIVLVTSRRWVYYGGLGI